MSQLHDIQELLDRLGVICNLCKYFDMDIDECANGHRPWCYMIMTGPNKLVYSRKKCKDFNFAADTDECFEWDDPD